jgi:quinol monooxygenase YgiN|tara:strand:+ start:155 stop:442 length:288 start_codon:yes stop_codon:yes gene_type:complete
MGKVILEGYIVVSESDLINLKEHLDEHIKLTRAENGCIVFNVEQRNGKELIFDVYEEFSDKEAYYFHQERLKASPWYKATRKVERHYDVSGLEAT